MGRKILIIDDHDDICTQLRSQFEREGHSVTVFSSHDLAIEQCAPESFDLSISDLDVISEDAGLSRDVDGRALFRLFKVSAGGFRQDEGSDDELTGLIVATLKCKSDASATIDSSQRLREIIEIEMPSIVGLMHPVLGFLTEKVERLGVIDPTSSNLFVALDEAFANAIRHGNKSDRSKMVKISADISIDEASFTVEDEGDGFDLSSIPDPRDPANLLKASGRGVFFISNIMDEVRYNERGNKITMVKRADGEKTEG